MVDLHSEIGGGNPEAARKFSLSVATVNAEDLSQIASMYPGGTDVGMQEWIEKPDTDVLQNTGAAPCASFFIRIGNAGIMISGHFIDTHKEDADDYLEYAKKELVKKGDEYKASKKNQEIAIANIFEIDSFGRNPLGEFATYKGLLARIKDLTSRYGNKSVEAYLFGQNLPFGSNTLSGTQSDLLRRSRIETDLIASGVSAAKISDHRLSGYRYFEADDTLYIPPDNTIYRYRRKVLEPSPLWEV